MGNSISSKCQSQYQSQCETCNVCQSNQIIYDGYLVWKFVTAGYFKCENGHIFYVSDEIEREYNLKKQVNQLENHLKIKNMEMRKLQLQLQLCELKK